MDGASAPSVGGAAGAWGPSWWDRCPGANAGALVPLPDREISAGTGVPAVCAQHWGTSRHDNLFNIVVVSVSHLRDWHGLRVLSEKLGRWLFPALLLGHNLQQAA